MSEIISGPSLDFAPPIWVLSLPRSTDRRARIGQHLEGLGLGYEVIDAVDGRDLPPDECAREVDPHRLQGLIGRQLLPCEVACALSHRMLYQRQVDEGHEAVLILEDDAVLEPVVLELFSLRVQWPIDWELIYLYRGHTRVSIWGQKIVGSRKFVRFGSVGFGAVAYMVRLSAARKLLQYSRQIGAPADWLTGGAVRTGVRLYGIDPPCAHEFAPGPASSTMPESYAMYTPPPRQLSPAAAYIDSLIFRTKCLYQEISPFSLR